MENKATELRDFEKWLKGSIYSNKRTFEIIEIFKQSLNSNEQKTILYNPDEEISLPSKGLKQN